MSTLKLRGVHTALVTPMNSDGSLDFGALDNLVDSQLAAGISGLVPCGTTGEAATLSAEERLKITLHVAKRVSGRVPVVVGAGSNSTAVAIENIKQVKEAGADCALVVTPYYNKPTPEGLYRHYRALAQAVDFPILVYNVPGRTGCDLKPETLAKIATLPKIIGVKEATGELGRLAAIRSSTPPEFALLSGDDGTTCPFVLLGGDGVISVTSNVAPKEMVAMVEAALKGDLPTARQKHNQLQEIFGALFLESNPIPVKAALHLQGLITEAYRLPLCAMSAGNRSQLEASLKRGGFIAK